MSITVDDGSGGTVPFEQFDLMMADTRTEQLREQVAAAEQQIAQQQAEVDALREEETQKVMLRTWHEQVVAALRVHGAQVVADLPAEEQTRLANLFPVTS